MKRLTGLLAFLVPFFAAAGEFSSTLVVQTGFLREGDLRVVGERIDAIGQVAGQSRQQFQRLRRRGQTEIPLAT